jgi:hypothetical protein
MMMPNAARTPAAATISQPNVRRSSTESEFMQDRNVKLGFRKNVNRFAVVATRRRPAQKSCCKENPGEL